MEPFTNHWRAPKPTRIFTHNISDITLRPVAGLLGWRLQLSSCSKRILHPVTTSRAQSAHIYFPPLLLKGPLWTIFITQNHLCPAEPLSREIPFFSPHMENVWCTFVSTGIDKVKQLFVCPGSQLLCRPVCYVIQGVGREKGLKEIS